MGRDTERPIAQAAGAHPEQRRSHEPHDRSAAGPDPRASGRRDPGGLRRSGSGGAGPAGDGRAGGSQPGLRAAAVVRGRHLWPVGSGSARRRCSRTWWRTPSGHGQAEHGVQVTIEGASAGAVRVEVRNRGAIPARRMATLFEPMRGRPDGVGRAGAGPVHHARAGPRPRRRHPGPVGSGGRGGDDVHRDAAARRARRRRGGVIVPSEAMVLHAPATSLEREAREPAAPRPGMVVIQVGACGVCRTDLQIAEGDLQARHLPIVPGHQAVGRIVAVGRGRRPLEDRRPRRRGLAGRNLRRL